MENVNEALIKPVAAKERVKEMDLIRGFALFGVLLVNLAMINTTLFTQMALKSPLSNPLSLEGGLNRLAGLLIQILAEGKFYTIFSFLFGLGFYVFMERAAIKHPKPTRLFLRRSFFLLIFGILHFSLVWYGDILHVYGIIGFLLLMFRNRKLKTIRNWIFILLILSTFIFTSLTFLNELVMVVMDPQYIEEYQTTIYTQMDESLMVYQSGSYIDVLSYRLKNEAGYTIKNLLFLIPKILGMFLIGLYVGKKGVLENVKEHLSLIKKTCLWAGIGFAISTIIFSIFKYDLVTVSTLLAEPMAILLQEISTVFGSVFYITSLVLLWQKPKFAKYLQPLTSMGQMALTNYLVQCIVASFIFYGYGLGLLNRVGLAVGVLITFVIYGIQLIYSKAWLAKHKYGPFEWVWRKLTYGGTL
ncbi:DUF418 domain-containing protein [Alkaliphilus hydrothermalis]|uniref:DUF418 domain-containing protein n=1 Tax=Alkaliphilus hydrothermalis TaxID=1482730 RepID=A0ABS2NS28_9FIRM|nr:DUF418 domain-containing protein [Alkaliphilus hydrothermalis]MBM7615764.1 uncharacterized protein [Alkaliphilus hydrothermalis]